MPLRRGAEARLRQVNVNSGREPTSSTSWSCPGKASRNARKSFLLSFFSKINGYECALRDREAIVFDVLYLMQDRLREEYRLLPISEGYA